MDIYLAIAAPVLLILMLAAGAVIPVLMAKYAVYNSEAERIIGILFLPVLALFFIAVFVPTQIKTIDRFYSWGSFEKDGIHIRNLFKGRRTIEYSRVVDVGIACYIHTRDPNADAYSPYPKIYYIYFSAGSRLEIRQKMNTKIPIRISPPNEFVWIRLNDENYEMISSVLPDDLRSVLAQDHERYLRTVKPSP